MAMLTAFWTVVSLLVFLGIWWWAWSAAREGANRESAMLPFALPDEATAETAAPTPCRNTCS
jgi:cytochrome c oxidase cbb3-type subunit 4